jgi:hypothetical protein
MGKLLVMPGVDPATIRPKATRVEAMDRHQRALVVVTDGTAFAIVRRSADGADEFNRYSYFHTHTEALQSARRIAACSPRYYPLVLDDTPRGRDSLENVLGLGPDPMGVKRLVDDRRGGRF